MRRIGDDMRYDPSRYVNRGTALPGGDGAKDVVVLEHGLVAGKMTHTLTIPEADFLAAEPVMRTNWQGDRVWVLPLCWINGEAVYPPIEIAPGERRRSAESAINSRYRAYREGKRQSSVRRGSYERV